MKNKGTPRNPRVRYHFKDMAFDFFLQWIQGAQSHGGSEGGECFYAASRIREGSSESWVREWKAMAERVAHRGYASLEGRHKVSARESFLRAYTYHRSALVFISPIEQPDHYLKEYADAQKYFRLAAELMEPELVPVEIPFESYHLPTYYQRSNGSEPAPLLIMIGGGDTFVEDLYPYIGPAAQKRGWNLVIVDFPVQGILPARGKIWRADSEKPMAAVIDYFQNRPEVNAEAIVSYGISGGGYLVPRAAAYEHRLAACAACSVILDFSGVWNRKFTDLWEKSERSLIHRMIRKYVEKKHEAYVVMVDSYVWRTGAGGPQGLVEATRDCICDPEIIKCPLLGISSEQEIRESPLFRKWTEETKRKAPNPLNSFVVMPENEGADSHAIGTNLSLMSQVLFDWFEDVLPNRSRSA